MPSGCVLPQSKEEAIEKTTHIVASGCESMSVPGTTLGSYDRQVQNIQRLTHEEIKEVLTGIARRCEENGALPPKMLLANPDFVTVNGDALEVMPGTISLLVSRHFERGLSKKRRSKRRRRVQRGRIRRQAR